MGACEFVMRLLARVTGEKSEAMYVCGFDAVGGRFPCLKGKKIERKQKKNFQGRTRKLNEESSVGPKKKKIHATSPQKIGDWSFSARDRTLELTTGFPTNSFVQSGCEARGQGEHGATGCTWTRVLASAAWRALKGASQAVCGPRGRSVVSAGSLPGP